MIFVAWSANENVTVNVPLDLDLKVKVPLFLTNSTSGPSGATPITPVAFALLEPTIGRMSTGMLVFVLTVASIG